MSSREGRLHQYITVGGLAIHARVSAEMLPKDVIAVVLIHGLAVSGRDVISTAELLAPSYQVYVSDLPGYGESDKPEPVLELPELADSLPSIDRWRTVLNRARQHGEFVGVEEDKYPRDFTTLIRYYTELQRKILVRYPLPTLTLEQLDMFIQEAGSFQYSGLMLKRLAS